MEIGVTPAKGSEGSGQKWPGVMQRLTFAEIEPLVVNRQVDKESNTIHCIFACPVTGRQVSAQAYISEGTGFGDRLLDSASRSFWYEARYAVAQKICALLPYGFLRDVVQGTAWRMAYGGQDDVRSGGELDKATVEAFKSVQHEFEKNGPSWAAREVTTDFVTDFERQLKQAPISTNYESEILVRVLGHLAEIDGLDSAERDFLARFSSAFGSAQGEAPSRVELSELDSEVKPTVYMLAAALAMADRDSSAAEQAYLESLASDLGVGGDQARSLRRAAGQFVVEECIYPGTSVSPHQLQQLSQLSGLDKSEVERVLVRRRKRTS